MANRSFHDSNSSHIVHYSNNDRMYINNINSVIVSNLMYGVLLFDEEYDIKFYNRKAIDRISSITGKKNLKDLFLDFFKLFDRIISEEEACQGYFTYDINENYILEVITEKIIRNDIITDLFIVFIDSKTWFDECQLKSIDSSLKMYALTKKEREIAYLLLKGCTYNQIAISLKLSTNTVKEHVKHIYKKADVSNKGEFIALILSNRS